MRHHRVQPADECRRPLRCVRVGEYRYGAPPMGVPWNAVATTTDEFWQLCSVGRFDDAAAMMNESFVHDDRRGVLTNTIDGREATMTNNRLIVEMGFAEIVVEALATRGEHRVLAGVAYRTEAGDELVALQVLDTNEAGLRTGCVSSEETEFDAALRELDI